MKDRRQELQETLNVLGGQVHHSQGKLESLKVLLIINGGDLDAARLVEVLELLGGGELVPGSKKRKKREEKNQDRVRSDQIGSDQNQVRGPQQKNNKKKKKKKKLEMKEKGVALGLFLICCAQDKLVKTVVIPLLGSLVGDTTLLKEVVDDGGTTDALLPVELHLHELTEARGIVVPHSLGISYSKER